MSGPRPRSGTRFLPVSPGDLRACGWDEVDVVFVSGDAYVDHPSFAAALLGRVLEAAGYRVAILAQPDWRDVGAFRLLGRPRLFFAVSGGNMDSMVNHYTANKKRRNDDAYSPGGRIGLRPDRASNVYAQRCREAFPGVPVVIGGVEASLRRIAHYDFWSDTVKPSVLVSSKAHLLGYGMGEETIVEIARRLEAGTGVGGLRDLRGVAYLLGAREDLPDHRWDDVACDNRTVELPTFEEVKDDPRAFARMTRLMHAETNPLNGRRLVQKHRDRLLVVNPPLLPLDSKRLDRIYDLPYSRRPHPSYCESIPAFRMIKDSVTIMRGCFGGCSFCSITMHQGRAIQSRSSESVVREVRGMVADPNFSGSISDIGGPTANMYRMGCRRPETEQRCRRISCLHPTICVLLDTSQAPTVELMRRVRQLPGIKTVRVASGVRMDLACLDQEYLDELVRHHVGGQLKVAPEHASGQVLELMKKPSLKTFVDFAAHFNRISRRAAKRQFLVPYFIASHPGSGVDEMIELALFLKQRGYKPRQVQDFLPAPLDIATCMYHTGLDPMTMRPVRVVRHSSERAMQRALMQYFLPENWSLVKKALEGAGRTDLIGDGPSALIPARPPKGAYRRRSRAVK